MTEKPTTAQDPPDSKTGNEAQPGDTARAYNVFSGFCMGTADVVPGVSGGTMAVALGIYSQLIAAITSVNMAAMKKLLMKTVVLSVTEFEDIP